MSIEFNKKEITWIIISMILFAFAIIFPLQDPNLLLLLLPIIIILTNTMAKKYAANRFNLKITYNVWQFQRYGLATKFKFKKPIPIGLILPIFLSFFSLGIIKAMTFLQFDYEDNKQKRLLRNRGRIRREELNESDPGYTAAWGFYSLLILSVIAAILNSLTDFQIFTELAKYSLYYGAWNLLPISNLDGTKLFFGNFFNWAVLVLIFFVALMTTAGL